MKKYLLILLCLFGYLTNFAQVNSRGITPNQKKNGTVGTKRALIVGISDYQDNNIADLQYAHNDAYAFYNFLQSKTGGNLKDNQIELLANDKATLANLGLSLVGLIEKSQEGDEVILYFSGHGDMDANLITHESYLVPHNAVFGNYMGSAFPINTLKNVIATLVNNGVSVTAYFDACHSGTIGQGKLGSTQLSNEKLSASFANETKLMSCQVNESSLEGKQWGGGRGCFSYHLINGLNGKADSNEDGAINLLEIERYLQDWVSKEVAPHKQFPVSVGDKTTVLSNIVEGETSEPTSSPVAQFTSTQKKKNNSNLHSPKVVADFYKSLENFPLIDTPNSAESYYDKIIQNKSLMNHHAQVKRDFATALMHEAQTYLNLLLNGSTSLIDAYTYEQNQTVEHFPNYLEKAKNILGEDHYFYPNIQQKEYFFRAIALKNELMNGHHSKGQIKRKRKAVMKYYRKALAIETTAAFVHLGLSQSYFEQDNIEESIAHIDKAIFFAPKWTLAVATKGRLLAQSNRNTEAIYWLGKAIAMDSTQLFPIQWQVSNYRIMGNDKLANKYGDKLIKLIQKNREGDTRTPMYYDALLAIAYSEVGAFEQADSLFQKVFQVERNDGVLLHASALNHYRMKQKDKAMRVLELQKKYRTAPSSLMLEVLMQLEEERPKLLLKKINRAIQLNPNLVEAYWIKGKILERLNKQQQAAENYWQAFEEQPFHQKYIRSLIYYFDKQNLSVETLEKHFDRMNKYNKDNPYILKEFAGLFNKIGAVDKAIPLLQKALILKQNE